MERCFDIPKKVLSIPEAAKALSVSTSTVRRAIKAGTIQAFQINPNGRYKIPIKEIEKFTNRGE